MLSSTDHDKLQQIIQEHPETEELFNRIFKSHQMDISTISHEIRNPLTLVYSTLQLIESQHPEVLEFAHWSELHQDIEYMKLLLEDLSSYNNGERLDLAPLSTGSFFRRIALSFASSIIKTNYPAFTVPRGFKCRNNREINDTHTNLTTSIYCSKPSSITSPVESKRTELRALR